MKTNEEALLESFEKSKLWRWMREYLLSRQNALVHAEPKTTEDLWKKEGALHEINRLVRAPQLVLEFYRAQRALVDDPPTPAVNGEDRPKFVVDEADWL